MRSSQYHTMATAHARGIKSVQEENMRYGKFGVAKDGSLRPVKDWLRIARYWRSDWIAHRRPGLQKYETAVIMLHILGIDCVFGNSAILRKLGFIA